MTAAEAPLYMMSQYDIESGETRILYGHATANVPTKFWEAYAYKGSIVEIQQVDRRSLMATPRRNESKVKNERDQYRDMIEYMLSANRMIDLLSDPTAAALARKTLFQQLTARVAGM